MSKFVAVVLADTEETWRQVFQSAGERYAETTLVLFSGATQSGCGYASAQSGPFYCPADSKVYIDLSFYDQLRRQFDAPGDFAQAYVIAHEVGHHVQNLIGVLPKFNQMRMRMSKAMPTRCRCASSCRPIVSPASGRATPPARGCWRRATSRRR